LQSQAHKGHREKDAFPNRFQELNHVKQRMFTDGVRQSNYQVISSTTLPDHTHILVELFFPQDAKKPNS
jgi:REP element-mobilizing transposase RayT